ncbi:MAG TPA: hypothetical protein VFK57_02410 [Vicinamibacterales bacterium]|nr:hypothetical protein [Vicinamibacterales bacterium]
MQHQASGLRMAASVFVLSLAGFHAAATPVATRPAASLLASHLLVTWYGNPHSAAMGVLGQAEGEARAAALRGQAACYAPLTAKRVLPAFHLVAVVAQKTAGTDGRWRRRESLELMTALLAEARRYGFALVLDVQPGRSTVADEIQYLLPMLAEPDVHLALDPEFAMSEGQRPGGAIGHMHASEINAALDAVERVRLARALPPKVVIVHQFTIGMLPDKPEIRARGGIDLVLDMDGFGPRPLKRASYRAVNRQFALPFAGFKLFYRQDTNLFDPAEVMQLEPLPSVVIYQ